MLYDMTDRLILGLVSVLHPYYLGILANNKQIATITA